MKSRALYVLTASTAQCTSVRGILLHAADAFVSYMPAPWAPQTRKSNLKATERAAQLRHIAIRHIAIGHIAIRHITAAKHI
jgi:hypothetical protein